MCHALTIQADPQLQAQTAFFEAHTQAIGPIRYLPGIWELSLHEELLGALSRVEVAFTRDALHLLQLSRLCSSLNVPEACTNHLYLRRSRCKRVETELLCVLQQHQ